MFVFLILPTPLPLLAMLLSMIFQILCGAASSCGSRVAPSSEAEIRWGRRVEGELRPRVEVPDVRPAAVRDLETGPAGAAPRASSSVENSLLK